MTATYKEATDEILEQFASVWTPTGYPVVWENVASDKPSTVTPWARPVVRHTISAGQSTLANINGQRCYERNGLVNINIFAPSGKGLSELYELAKVVADAFDGKSTQSSVWFRNVRVLEVGPDTEWFRVDVVAEFTYNEVK